MESNNRKIAELIAERTRINKEISSLRRRSQEAAGIKIVRCPTGRMDFRVRVDEELESQMKFRTVASSWNLEDLIERARRVSKKINEFCEKTTEQIEEVIANS